MISNDQKMTISLIESMDELKLKQFLFHNLESVDPHLYKLLFNKVTQEQFPNRVWGSLNYMVGNRIHSYREPERNPKTNHSIYFYDVILRTDKFFLNLPNFGKKSLKELKLSLDKFGLKLNTDLKDIKYEALKSLSLINLKHDYLFVEKRGFVK